MKRNRAQLKAELLAAAEEKIDEMLDWNEETEAPTLTQIEDVILELRKQLGEQLMGVILEDQDAVRPVPGPACQRCGREMHYKGMKETTIGARTGEVAIERAYYYCKRCRCGLFPPRSAIGSESGALE